MRQARTTLLLSAVVLATLLLCAGAASAAPLTRYTLVPIQDTSATPYWPDTNSSSRFAVNAGGEVVGTAWDYNGDYLRGFAWSASGGFRTLGLLAGDGGSAAYGINAAGQIAGVSTPTGGGAGRAVVWSAQGTPTNLHQYLPAPVGVPPQVEVDAYSEARGITTTGRIVGNYNYSYSYWQEDVTNPDGGYNVDVSVHRPVLWTPDGQGGYTAEQIANSGTAYGISPSGQHVAGQSPHWSGYLNQTVDSATRWTLLNDAWTENVLFNNWSGGGNAANDLGTTAGFTNVPLWNREADAWREGGSSADLGGGSYDTANALDINATEQIAGSYHWGGGACATLCELLGNSGSYIVVGWYDLNDYIDPALGIHLINGHAINDQGWIVASDTNGQTYLLMPEPATMLLVAAGAVALAARRAKPSR